MAAAFLVLAAGCGNGSPESGSDAETSQEGEDNSGATAPTQPAAPTYRLLSTKGLTRALLGIQAMPAGYSQDPPTPDSLDKTFCDYKPPFTQKVKVSRDFTKGGGMSAELLRVGLRQYANPQQARASFKALTRALATCTGETYNGTKMTYAPMSAPKVGDGSVGVKITADGTPLLQTFALVGPTLVNSGGGGLMNASADDVNTLLRAQVKAYKRSATK